MKKSLLVFIAVAVLADILTTGGLLDSEMPKCDTCSPNSGFPTLIPYGVQSGLKTLLNIIPLQEIENIFKISIRRVLLRDELEQRLDDKGRTIPLSEKITDPSIIRHKGYDIIIRRKEKSHLVFEEATNLLCKRYNLTSEHLTQHLPQHPMSGELGKASNYACQKEQTIAECDPEYMYRTANGQCNNINNPTWGMSLTCQRRLLPASYFGSSEFRRSKSGDALPDPRTVSLNLHFPLGRQRNHITNLYTFFGQFLAHDITLTPSSTTVDNQAINCCPPDKETHPQCRPISIRSNDSFYSQFEVTCLNFVRSAICNYCALGPRVQMNQVTSFIDASFLYGNSEDETNSLRMHSGEGCLLRTQKGNLLPKSPNPSEDQCSVPEKDEICFLAGDSRANQHTILASLHTVFMREHNRIANSLKRINSHWNDETIFQEARRIVGAEMQVITYMEYLPITLGDHFMSHFKLWISEEGYSTYNPKVDPTVLIELTTAALRFGHSLVNTIITRTPLNETHGYRRLRDEFFFPFDLYTGLIGPLLSGASNSHANAFDPHLVPDVTNFLYMVQGDDTGLDLGASNINRGRDHGIPSYINMVQFCTEGEIVIKDFGDLLDYKLMEREHVEILRNNYRYVEDVDLWPAILMETSSDDAVIGRTGACIMGRQFHNLKFGDRFYFEHGNTEYPFTKDQLMELRKITLSKLFCLNTDMDQIPSNVMLFRSKKNPLMNCRHVKGIDLSFWEDKEEDRR